MRFLVHHQRDAARAAKLWSIDAPSLKTAAKKLRTQLKDPRKPPGRYWLCNPDGLPVYAVHATDEPATERVPLEREAAPGIVVMGGFTTRTIPRRLVRRVKGGYLPWSR